MASRTIENDKERKMTIMTTTFVPCGAKLPIIALISGALFGGAWWVAPSAYFVGIAAIIPSPRTEDDENLSRYSHHPRTQASEIGLALIHISATTTGTATARGATPNAEATAKAPKPTCESPSPIICLLYTSFFAMHVYGEGSLSEADVNFAADAINYSNIGR